MSNGRKTVKYATAAAMISALIIGASILYIGIPSLTHKQSLQGYSPLAIRLTDPPLVPKSTSSLNLTYSSVSLLVGEPSGPEGKLSTSTITLTPPGGSATLDLLKLQNVSLTIASTALPNGSEIYSVTFTVTKITIDVNGTVSPVVLASGGTTFSVTIAHSTELSGSNFALIQLNPVVVDTPSGYQLIPSAVGIVEHTDEQGVEEVGAEHELSANETASLDEAQGNITASLVAFSVSGNSTTATFEVKNTGNASVELEAIGLHGNFTALGSPPACQGGEVTTTTTTQTTTSHNASETTTQTTSETTTEGQECVSFDHSDEVVFVPVAESIASSGSSCAPGALVLENNDAQGDQNDTGLTLNPGQCVDLTFTGPISFGESQLVLVPSTVSGQAYTVHIIASEGANQDLSCVLPAGPASCTALLPSEQD